MTEEKYYKTNEVCKLHNITKKTLLYYDKIDLFKPDYIDETNNYRYYARENFPILKQIIYLKNIGMNLNEIKHLLNNRSHDLMISTLKDKKIEVEIQKEKLSRIHKSIDYLINYYEHASAITDNDLNRPSIKMLNPRKVILQEAEEASKEGVMLAYRSILNCLREVNMFSPEDYGAVYFQEVNNRVGSYIVIPWEMEVPMSMVNITSEGKHICMYHKGSYYNPEPKDYLLNWLKENNYQPIGPIYDVCIIDRTFANSEDEMIMELQVRVQ